MAKARLTKKHIKQMLDNSVNYYTGIINRIKDGEVKWIVDYPGRKIKVNEDMCIFAVVVLKNIIEQIHILETEAPEKIKNI